jgi:multiple stress resistance protein BhsA
MQRITFILAALFILSTTQPALTAVQINDSTGKQRIGVVSVSNALTLDELVNQLAEKADRQGASAFRVLATTGNNKLHGDAEIYK